MKAPVIVAWLLVASLAWFAAPAATQRCPFGSGPELHGESLADYRARREAIAAAAVAVALDPAEAPVFDGPEGRARTAALMMSIARFESGYCKRVDEGLQRGPGGEVCVMQVSLDGYRKGVGAVTAEGWSAADLISDRQKCMRAALHKIQASFRICGDASHPQNVTRRALVGADRLSLYTGTRCTEGSPFARHRYELGEAWYASHPIASASASTSASSP